MTYDARGTFSRPSLPVLPGNQRTERIKWKIYYYYCTTITLASRSEKKHSDKVK